MLLWLLMNEIGFPHPSKLRQEIQGSGGSNLHNAPESRDRGRRCTRTSSIRHAGRVERGGHRPRLARPGSAGLAGRAPGTSADRRAKHDRSARPRHSSPAPAAASPRGTAPPPGPPNGLVAYNEVRSAGAEKAMTASTSVDADPVPDGPGSVPSSSARLPPADSPMAVTRFGSMPSAPALDRTQATADRTSSRFSGQLGRSPCRKHVIRCAQRHIHLAQKLCDPIAVSRLVEAAPAAAVDGDDHRPSTRRGRAGRRIHVELLAGAGRGRIGHVGLLDRGVRPADRQPR